MQEVFSSDGSRTGRASRTTSGSGAGQEAKEQKPGAHLETPTDRSDRSGPDASDPTRCAHCGEGERSGAMIVPFGTEARRRARRLRHRFRGAATLPALPRSARKRSLGAVVRPLAECFKASPGLLTEIFRQPWCTTSPSTCRRTEGEPSSSTSATPILLAGRRR